MSILGNEKADELAKFVVFALTPKDCALPSGDCISHFKPAAIQSWQFLWQLVEHNKMVECPSYIDERDKYFLNCKDVDGNYSLSKILGCDFNVNNLFSYIEEIVILNKI